jgi:hypothetical protein
MGTNVSFGNLLAWTITAAAILTALWFAWYQAYLFAGAFALLLVAYVYLARYGGEPIEERIV